MSTENLSPARAGHTERGEEDKGCNNPSTTEKPGARQVGISYLARQCGRPAQHLVIAFEGSDLRNVGGGLLSITRDMVRSFPTVRRVAREHLGVTLAWVSNEQWDVMLSDAAKRFGVDLTGRGLDGNERTIKKLETIHPDGPTVNRFLRWLDKE